MSRGSPQIDDQGPVTDTRSDHRFSVHMVRQVGCSRLFSGHTNDVKDLSGFWIGAKLSLVFFVILQLVQQVGINQPSSNTATSNLRQSLSQP